MGFVFCNQTFSERYLFTHYIDYSKALVLQFYIVQNSGKIYKANEIFKPGYKLHAYRSSAPQFTPFHKLVVEEILFEANIGWYTNVQGRI